jgi:hypothetical protein
MIKNNTTLLVICFTLLIIANGCGKSSNAANTEVATTNTTTVRANSSTESNSGTKPLSAPTVAPTPDSSPKTVQVRLTEVETNADLIDSPLPDLKIIIKSGETSLDKKTNDAGVAVFDSVPCGNDIEITALNDNDSGENGVFHRELKCEGTQVDLGVITRAYGGRYTLEQRKPESMGYDPAKNVWRTDDGKIVPMERVRKIIEKYQ